MIGTTIRGYQFWERIGEGGAGTVFKAYQSSLGRHVAIKVLKPTYARNVEFIHRFQTEAELVARLEHPHINPFESGSLGQIISRHLEQPLPSIQDQGNDIPHAVDVIMQKATAKKREQRYAEVLAFAADFRTACRC